MIIVTMANWREIDITNIEQYDFKFSELAMPISMVNRYVGGLIRPLSVAEHSVRLHDSPQVQALGLAARKAALAHDTSEGLMTDLINPIKRDPMASWYVELENKVQRHLFKVFDIPWADMEAICPFDRRICQDEVMQLRPGGRGFNMEPLGIDIPEADMGWLYWYNEMMERADAYGLD